ncbi:alpha/beta hydrolase [Ramlibacter sp. G-1-2-2]|uniref:Alpha/beta hydrolase n=1 Tax=Ramlibacter agri TaxID=2728837 RepID=A0A848H3U6_9BURK|nr:alpha/beta hydrolase [Ramlibacter agri]NML44402.1 alpha/beta hydrolase [Ramlibacter agri]
MQTLVVDGVEVQVEGTGPETLLLLHGWPDTLQLWDPTVEVLRDRFRCVRFTLPGYAPGSPRVQPTLEEISGLLLHIVDQVSPEQPVTLVLHDWGCIFGYQFAMRHPQRVARIVGVDVGDAESLSRTLSKKQLLMVAGYQLWLALAWKIGGGLGDRMTRHMARFLRAPADPARISVRMNWPYHRTWFGGAQSLPRQSRPLRPACPMLFIYGKRKPLMFHSKRWTDELAQRPGSRVEAFETGHWVMVSDPIGFHRVLREWLPARPA